MEWIKVEDALPEEDKTVCILIYENWNKRHDGSDVPYPSRTPDEHWITCSGDYSTYEWYIDCKPGVEGGFGNIFNDYYEGQMIYVVAWCPMPDPIEIR